MGLLTIEQCENVPLVVDREYGTIRIPGTRLKLQTVIAMWYMGITDPEEMSRRFDTLRVETAKRILEWYHTRQEDVDAYMEWIEQRAQETRTRLEDRMVEHRRRHLGRTAGAQL